MEVCWEKTPQSESDLQSMMSGFDNFSKWVSLKFICKTKFSLACVTEVTELRAGAGGRERGLAGGTCE